MGLLAAARPDPQRAAWTTRDNRERWLFLVPFLGVALVLLGIGRVLDELGRREEAGSHWHAFLELAPDSPWATIARQRLE